MMTWPPLCRVMGDGSAIAVHAWVAITVHTSCARGPSAIKRLDGCRLFSHQSQLSLVVEPDPSG